MANLKSILENTTNAALLVVCSLLAWLFLTHHDLWLHGGQDPIKGRAWLQDYPAGYFQTGHSKTYRAS